MVRVLDSDHILRLAYSPETVSVRERYVIIGVCNVLIKFNIDIRRIPEFLIPVILPDRDGIDRVLHVHDK